jgi:hypothetical protein
MFGSEGRHTSLLDTFNDRSRSVEERSTREWKYQFGFGRPVCLSYGLLSLATVPLGKSGLKQRGTAKRARNRTRTRTRDLCGA